ncbi:monoglyceride lipase-like, partial [Limulus polyphemus]|uniref:Monoglyceride lipase-like n=1 Tax=Limulus polyphemus TaxID=6850 RepID=A0ABM1TRE0_LIMPO
MERNEIEEAVDKSSCYITSSSGYQLYSKYWFPVGHPRALVFIAHGFAEHCMCFDDLAKTLACHELLVFSHDHVGHGRSEGPRTLIGSIDDCVQDVLHHVDLVKVMYPGCPVFLLGNSM